MDHNAGPWHILVAEEEGRIWFNIICLKLYQFEIITWWSLYILEFALQFVLKYVMLEKLLKKSRSPKICRGPWNLIHSPPCRTPCRFFPSMKSSSGVAAFTFVREMNMDSLRPSDRGELLDRNGHMPSIRWPSTCPTFSKCHLLACQNGSDPPRTDIKRSLFKTSNILPPRMHQKLTKHGRLYKQKQPTPYQKSWWGRGEL